jgi:hypothetical protein
MIKRRRIIQLVAGVIGTSMANLQAFQILNDSWAHRPQKDEIDAPSFDHEVESCGLQILVLAVGLGGSSFARGINASSPFIKALALFQGNHSTSQIQTKLAGKHLAIIAIFDAEGVELAVTIERIAKEAGVPTVTIWGGAERPTSVIANALDSLVLMNPSAELSISAMGQQRHTDAPSNQVSMQNLISDFWRVINVEHHIAIDFEDVKTVVGIPGYAQCEFGQARGPERAETAANQLLRAVSLGDWKLESARGVLVCIVAGKNALLLSDTRLIINMIRARLPSDAYVLYGTAEDVALGDEIRVSLVATGLSALQCTDA